MLDIGTREGVSMERFDVEDNGHDVEVSPEPGAQIGALKKINLCAIATGESHTSFKRLRVTPAPRNLQRCSCENLLMVSMTWFSITEAFLAGSLEVNGTVVEEKSVL